MNGTALSGMTVPVRTLDYTGGSHFVLVRIPLGVEQRFVADDGLACLASW